MSKNNQNNLVVEVVGNNCLLVQINFTYHTLQIYQKIVIIL
jgi:hypothetical protein